jgi:hypothetical protein
VIVRVHNILAVEDGVSVRIFQGACYWKLLLTYDGTCRRRRRMLPKASEHDFTTVMAGLAI